MNEIKVKLSMGEVTLKEPRAKHRNKAIMESVEFHGGKQEINMMKFLVTLLPYCIGHHPWGMKPVREALDNLSIKDYDALSSNLRKLIGEEEDVKKKSEEQSEVKEE